MRSSLSISLPISSLFRGICAAERAKQHWDHASKTARRELHSDRSASEPFAHSTRPAPRTLAEAVVHISLNVMVRVNSHITRQTASKLLSASCESCSQVHGCPNPPVSAESSIRTPAKPVTLSMTVIYEFDVRLIRRCTQVYPYLPMDVFHWYWTRENGIVLYRLREGATLQL